MNKIRHNYQHDVFDRWQECCRKLDMPAKATADCLDELVALAAALSLLLTKLIAQQQADQEVMIAEMLVQEKQAALDECEMGGA